MREISIFKERILQYAKDKGISKYEIYQNTGISNGVFSQKGGLSEENVLKFLSHYMDVSPEWLLTGNGSMIKEAVAEKKETNTDIKPLVDLLSQMHAEVKDLSSQLSMQISENKKLMRENEILRKENIDIENYNNFKKEKLIEKEKVKDKPTIISDRRVHSINPNNVAEKNVTYEK